MYFQLEPEPLCKCAPDILPFRRLVYAVSKEERTLKGFTKNNTGVVRGHLATYSLFVVFFPIFNHCLILLMFGRHSKCLRTQTVMFLPCLSIITITLLIPASVHLTLKTVQLSPNANNERTNSTHPPICIGLKRHVLLVHVPSRCQQAAVVS